MPRIAGVAAAFPPFQAAQADITAAIAPIITGIPAKRALLNRLHENSRVDTRNLVRPLHWYREPHSFTETNALFVTEATALACTAVTEALTKAGLSPADVDYVLFTSVTGVSAPSVDALVALELGFRRDVKRVPMFGLGCVAGAAGVSHAADFLLGHPDATALVIAVELCSLTFQHGDDSMGNLVATGLFGDGAAAVVLVGSRRAAGRPVTGPDVVATRSILYPATTDVIGFDAGESGFHVVLTSAVTDVIDANFGRDAHCFLSEQGLALNDISVWIAHPGGPRVLDAFAEALGLPPAELDLSFASMAENGNMSSVSVLHILGETIARGRFAADAAGMLFALGPGVSAELVLLRWPGANHPGAETHRAPDAPQNGPAS